MEHKIKKNITRILFICKQRPARYGASYGLLNSCRFLCNALRSMGAEAEVIEVIDNNSIDREIHKYKPTHVFIEALWVVPEKFKILIPLHPKVQWYVRLHSNTSFIANEGMAMDWIIKYAELSKEFPQFHIAPNSPRMIDDLKRSLNISTIYAPNVYQPHISSSEFPHSTPKDKNPFVFDVGCFGAIRPLKNQLIQAMAAMAFANELGKTLHFHINYSRVETNGENAYKNLEALFNGTPHKMIIHEWIPHTEFLHLIQKMDMGLQVSFSETFNIVAADFVHMKVPIVGSDEIGWMNALYQAKPTSLDNIVSHMWLAWMGKKFNLHSINNWGLEEYNSESRKVWKLLLNIQ
jgi:hypothetical protein